MSDMQKLCLKGLYGLNMYVNTPTLGFNIRATARRVPVKYREWVKWKWGEGRANPQKQGSGTVHSLSSPTTQNHKAVKQVA